MQLKNHARCSWSGGYFAKLIEAHHFIIGKYTRDEVKPSIDVVKKLATVLDTTVGYLLGETADQVLKDPSMLKRLNDIMAIPKDEQDHIIYTIDAMIKAAKINAL